MPARTPQEIWETALGEIQVQVSKPNYRTWFNKTTGLNYKGNQFVVGVPNTFVAEYLGKNQRSLIEKALTGLTAPGITVVFQVNGKSHHNGESEQGMPAAAPTYSSLNSRYVFDSFVEGSCNRVARAAAQAVAQNPGHSYNPLYIYGGTGLGKTHLLHAIGHAASANHVNVICTSAEQFTNEFVTALRDKSTEEFRNKYRSIGMLLVDDIHFIIGKEHTEESFFHTFNELHNTNRQIVITSDCPPKSMPHLEDRLRSRFEWGLTVDIQPPDFETRLEILKSKARIKEMEIGQDVIEHIAGQAQHNIRELEGALNRVIAFAKLLRSAINIELAARALSSLASKESQSHQSSITPDFILAAVADHFQMTREDLAGRKRDKDTALARRVAMYLLRQETNGSLAQIGQSLGGRDAAAVNIACKKIVGEVEQSPFLKRKINDIQKNIYSECKTHRPV